MKRLVMIALLLGAGNWLAAQVTTGRISGKVLESDEVTGLPGAKVWIDTESGSLGVMCDSAGRYGIDALKPGVYNVHARFIGIGEMTIAEVKVSPDAITTVNFIMDSKILEDVDVFTYKEPLISKDVPRLHVSTEDIENSPYIRDPKMLLTSMSSDVKLQEGSGQVIIRGSRPGDAVYYVDGVKADDLGALPGVAIGSMEAYTGGIPAKYGDTTGGVVILESKSYFDLYNAWLVRQ